MRRCPKLFNRIAALLALPLWLHVVAFAAGVSSLPDPSSVAPGKTAAVPVPIIYEPGREVARLANPGIIESSGLAASRIQEGIFWTHNDSGGKPVLFAFNREGEDLGAYELKGATAVDWEDMASFSVGQKRYLLVADVGDNIEQRKSYTLYFVEEPAVRARPGKPLSLSVVMRVDFTYEDGPHNCESVAVDPVRMEILLVSKVGSGGCKMYVLPLPRQKLVRNAVAKAVGALQIPTTTAMDISPDGLRAVVLTYGDAYEYARRAGEDWKAAVSRAPRTIAMPRRTQGEAICYGLNGRTLYLTSEMAPSPLLEVAPLSAEKAAGSK